MIQTDTGEARTNACSILWSFAARDEKSDAGKASIMLYSIVQQLNHVIFLGYTSRCHIAVLVVPSLTVVVPAGDAVVVPSVTVEGVSNVIVVVSS